VYGNPYALDAIQARASAEPSPPEIVFNGDFHYLDTDPTVFRAIDDRVRAHHATLSRAERSTHRWSRLAPLAPPC
jgi:hypothetical protein